MNNRIKNIIKESIDVKEIILSDNILINIINEVSNIITDCFKNGGKVLLCGNGGSAADAQHIAAEFSGRFYFDRSPLFAEALHVNTSYLTAVANDYSFDEIYARLIKAMGKSGDILICISTSGNSENILKAAKTANDLNMTTIAFTGANGGKLKNECDYLINVPSSITPRIQESHIMIGHIICELVEEKIFKK